MMASQNSTLLSSLSSLPATGHRTMMMQMAGGGVQSVSLVPMASQQHQTSGTLFTSTNANGMSFNGTTYLGGDQVASHLKVPFTVAPAYPTPATPANSLATTVGPPSVNEASLAILMERLHGRSNQMKSWNDLSKSLKQSLLEKRPFVTDSNEKVTLQLALDTLQNNIEVKSYHSMVERLEAISRQMKLKFNNTVNQCFISTDMYYVEVKFDAETGCIDQVNVVHSDAKNTGNEVKLKSGLLFLTFIFNGLFCYYTKKCEELKSILLKRNFSEFTKHLEGLSAIYKVDCDKYVLPSCLRSIVLIITLLPL